MFHSILLIRLYNLIFPGKKKILPLGTEHVVCVEFSTLVILQFSNKDNLNLQKHSFLLEEKLTATCKSY